MKATEFVKKYGIGKAVGILHEWNMFTQIEKPTHFDSDLDIFIHEDDFYSLDESDVCLIELKTLVNAYDLVEYYGGLEKSKLKVQGNRLSHKKTADLWKAVELVESVNE